MDVALDNASSSTFTNSFFANAVDLDLKIE